MRTIWVHSQTSNSRRLGMVPRDTTTSTKPSPTGTRASVSIPPRALSSTSTSVWSTARSIPRIRRRSRTLLAGASAIYICALIPAVFASGPPNSTLDRDLTAALAAAGFTGTIEQTFHTRIEANLGRPLNAKLVDLGRLLWFDTLHSLHADNTCGGCHSPSNGFGDSQPMAIGVQNNGLVGPNRSGPRNQRRSPLVINTPLYPAMMWNGRFNSLSGDPFDNSL